MFKAMDCEKKTAKMLAAIRCEYHSFSKWIAFVGDSFSQPSDLIQLLLQPY